MADAPENKEVKKTVGSLASEMLKFGKEAGVKQKDGGIVYTKEPDKKEEPKPEAKKEEQKAQAGSLSSLLEEKKEEPKAEAKPEATETGLEASELEDPTKKSRTEIDKSFKGLRTKLEAANTKLAAYTSAGIGSPEDLARVVEELKTLRAKASALDVENTPEFQETVIKPITQREQTLSALAKEYGVADELVANALRMAPGTKRDEALDGILGKLGKFAQPRFINAVSEYDALVQTRQAKIADADKIVGEFRNQGRLSLENQAKERNAALEKAVTSTPDVDYFFKHPDMVNVGSAIKSRAQALLTTERDPLALAQASIRAAAWPELMKVIEKLTTEKSQLQAKIKTMSGSAPSMGGGGGGTQHQEKPTLKSIHDSMRNVVRGGGGF